MYGAVYFDIYTLDSVAAQIGGTRSGVAASDKGASVVREVQEQQEGERMAQEQAGIGHAGFAHACPWSQSASPAPTTASVKEAIHTNLCGMEAVMDSAAYFEMDTFDTFDGMVALMSGTAAYHGGDNALQEYG